MNYSFSFKENKNDKLINKSDKNRIFFVNSHDQIIF